MYRVSGVRIAASLLLRLRMLVDILRQVVEAADDYRVMKGNVGSPKYRHCLGRVGDRAELSSPEAPAAIMQYPFDKCIAALMETAGIDHRGGEYM